MSEDTMLNESFDTDKEEGTPPRKLLPAGKYRAEITTATVGPTKKGDGTQVKLTWVIADGEYEKRYVFQNILIRHPSEKAETFGRQKFKDVCVSCGITGQVTDLNVLCYKACTITVIVRTDKTGEYADRNEVVNVLPVVAWNGPKPASEALKEATTTKESFKAEQKSMDDEIPW
jgi:Protein of unknown function (DUF669)